MRMGWVTCWGSMQYRKQYKIRCRSCVFMQYIECKEVEFNFDEGRREDASERF